MKVPVTAGSKSRKILTPFRPKSRKAFLTIQRTPVQLTGSSRTDAGVHALQNFFHFDFEGQIHPQALYKFNAILPKDIAVKNIFRVADRGTFAF
jgi:tRNA pseudouridine38-40 synthase